MAGGTIADGMVVDAAMQSGIMVGGMVDGTIVWHCKSLWRQDVGGRRAQTSQRNYVNLSYGQCLMAQSLGSQGSHPLKIPNIPALRLEFSEC